MKFLINISVHISSNSHSIKLLENIAESLIIVVKFSNDINNGWKTFSNFNLLRVREFPFLEKIDCNFILDIDLKFVIKASLKFSKNK